MIIFAAVGSIRLVALYVSVNIPSNMSVISVPSCNVPNAVIVVFQVICTTFQVAVARFVVVALAMSTPFAWSIRPVNAPPDLFILPVSSRAISVFWSFSCSAVGASVIVSPKSKENAVFVCVVAV